MKSKTPWLGALVLLVVAVGWWTRRARPGPERSGWPTPLRMSAVDRATGRPIEDAIWTLIATRQRPTGGTYDEGFAQGTLPATPSAEDLRNAARLALCAYGYEVRILEPDGLAALDGRVDLEPVADSTRVTLESDVPAVTSRKGILLLASKDPAAPSDALSLWWMQREMSLTREPLAVPVGRRQTVIFAPQPEHDGHLTWPYPLPLAALRPATLHVEATRRLAYDLPGGESPNAEGFGWLDVDPRTVATLGDARLGGLATHGNDGYESTPNGLRALFTGVPRVPVTGVVHLPGGWWALSLDAETTTLPVTSGAAPLRRLTSVSIDGAPPPEGTLLLPGTLSDGLVNSVLARGWVDRTLLGLRTPAPDAWREAQLPVADSLTAWHPERGLARLQWAENGAAAGAWEPGFVHVTRSPSYRGRVVVSVRSGCVASPLVTSGTSRADALERPLDASTSSLLSGVPFGPVSVEVRSWPPGAERPTTLRKRTSLDEREPCLRFAVAEDGTIAYEGRGDVPPGR